MIFIKVQKNYQLLRVERNNKIQQMSLMQGRPQSHKKPFSCLFTKSTNKENRNCFKTL